MTLTLATKWLKFASFALLFFGIYSALCAVPGFGIVRVPFLYIVLPAGELTAEIAVETRLLWAILGGICVGWGVMFWLLTTRLLDKETELVRIIMRNAILTWFVVDGLFSMLAGAPLNAVLNISFLLLFIIPVWRPIVGNTN